MYILLQQCMNCSSARLLRIELLVRNDVNIVNIVSPRTRSLLMKLFQSHVLLKMSSTWLPECMHAQLCAKSTLKSCIESCLAVQQHTKASFTARSLYPGANRHQYRSHRSRGGRLQEHRDILSLPRFEPRFMECYKMPYQVRDILNPDSTGYCGSHCPYLERKRRQI
jgi:hypothetical protein